MRGHLRTGAELDRPEHLVDGGLTTLLVLQCFTLFVAIPLLSGTAAGRYVLDGCHLAFAIVCIGVLTRHRGVQVALIAALLSLVAGPPLIDRIGIGVSLSANSRHEIIASAAFGFNGGVTALVARHVFAAGRVNAHRIRGAILLYLNVAALFAITYGAVAMHIDGAFALAAGPNPAGRDLTGIASYSYFSLTTITTTGYGDIVPVHALARSLANAEAVFGALFPATLLTRLVSLHLSHERDADGCEPAGQPPSEVERPL